MTIALAILIFTAAALAMCAVMLIASWLLRPQRTRLRSQEAYECGFPPQGGQRGLGFNYIQYAALFLVFDLAAIYLFLYAATSPEGTAAGLFGGVGILCLIIVYGAERRRYLAA